MIPFNKEEILAKQDTLSKCATYLKEEFVGIDNIIDEIINYLSIWYLMPDLLTRPIIINLWGMTGVGKTDLVRKLVNFLNFQDRFTEIELSNTEQGGYNNTVSAILEGNNLNDEKPAIVLFDEIQRFNTLNPDGSPLRQSKYTDFWELLSDGRLSRKEKEDLDTYLFNYLTSKKRNERAKARGEETDDNPQIESWEAMALKSNLRLSHTYDELSELKQSDVIKLINQAKQEKKIYEPIDHSKTLIIISGNLDEAFSMADQTSEADIDADIYRAFTQKITMVDIKNALTRKFRPEQVARFGNIHLIYNSLSKANFRTLIEKEVNSRIAAIREKFAITIQVTENVKELIYRNGVFPVQGVRPVFSSIIDILESNWSNSIFAALMNSVTELLIDYDFEAKNLVITTGEKKMLIPYVGRIDKIRQTNQQDVVANVSVHECGHAVAYMVLTGMAPLQLKSKIASSYAGGFTFPHQIHATKRSLLDKIKVFLAGGLAEELIFGKDHASTGRSNDRERATALAASYVRRYGFNEQFQAVYNLDEEQYKMDNTITDAAIEELIAAMVTDTESMLIQHQALLIDLSKELNIVGSMKAEEVKDIAIRHGLLVTIEEEGHTHITNYDEVLGKLG